MKKVILFQFKQQFNYSDKTICVIGLENHSLIGTDQSNWAKGEHKRPLIKQGPVTANFHFPTSGISGWAFGSIPAFAPKDVHSNAVQYPFGGQFLYGRLGSHQHYLLSAIISYLERVPGGILAPSGVAASHMAVMFNMPQGEVFLRSAPIYDCTRGAFDHIYSKLGMKSYTADFTNMQALEEAIKKYNPYKLYLETPANPTMAMIDLPEVYKLAIKHNIKEIIVDNTFASPIIQKPVEVVNWDPEKKIRIIHSGTKFFTGGLDGVVWGYVSLIDWKEYTPMLVFQKDMGFNMSGLDANAVLAHGMPTLHLRVKDQSANAMKVATFLNSHPLIKQVNYPGLPPYKEMADKMFTGEGYGSILHFELDDKQLSKEDSEAFGDILGLQSFISLGVSLGKVETLIQNSWFMVHRFMDETEKLKSGITPFGWRLSIGSEDVRDIISELGKSLDLLKNKEFRSWLSEFKEKLGTPEGMPKE
ncbi:MAG: aminotransferase class I/II-fold pyridoxal phosphate-dependent enzyme [Candidatus Margulisiibacteriota bacterium]|jgi:cystathionine beta-lyase/cystathionine gamma-synthase